MRGLHRVFSSLVQIVNHIVMLTLLVLDSSQFKALGSSLEIWCIPGLAATLVGRLSVKWLVHAVFPIKQLFHLSVK